MRFFSISIVVSFFFAALVAFSPVASAATSFETSGWIPYWRTATGTADVLPHLSDLTMINPFVYTVRSDGALLDNGKLSEDPWKSFIIAARQQKVRVIPTVMSGDGDAMRALLSNKTLRTAHIAAIKKMVLDNNFDGVDIDYENKPYEMKAAYSAFLKELYAAMGNKWVVCTIEPRTPVADRYEGTPPADASLYVNDYAVINKYCDRVIIMAYDQGRIDVSLNKAALGVYVPTADPLWVEKVVKLAQKQIASSKIIIGVPTYGYEYLISFQNSAAFSYERLWAFNPRYATDLAAQMGLSPTRNRAGEFSMFFATSTPSILNQVKDVVPTGVMPLAGSSLSSAVAGAIQTQVATTTPVVYKFALLWWSDAQAIQDKVTLAKKLGVRGVAVFKFDGGEDQGVWDVLKAAKK